ncbi:hypothetical protein ACFLZZ_02420 [Nanoarchaeota archaeon]
MIKVLDKLRVRKENLVLYQAGLPSFPRIVARDSIISAILLKDVGMMHDTLLFCIKNQGKKKDAISGEEPGKIHHEVPPWEHLGLNTKYNSCDSTALFLMGIKEYIRLSRDWGFVSTNNEAILNAVSYILSHLKGGVFYEDPVFCGAKRFALGATYWKDSQLIGRKNAEYPVAYFLAHVQNMAGLRAAAYLLKDGSLLDKANEMKEHINDFIDDDVGFILARDKKGPIKVLSSDSLHALFYLEKGDFTKDFLKEIVKKCKPLETTIGYRTMEPRKSDLCRDPYHCKTVWPFEQVLINLGAKRFALRDPVKVSERIMRALTTDSEYFSIDNKGKKFVKSGSDPQLWTIATKKYFGLN